MKNTMKSIFFTAIALLSLFCLFSCRNVEDINANSNVFVITISDDSYHGQSTPLNATNNDAYGFVKCIAELAPQAHVRSYMSTYRKSFVIDSVAKDYPVFDQMENPDGYVCAEHYNRKSTSIGFGPGSNYSIGYTDASSNFVPYSRIVYNSSDDKYYYNDSVASGGLGNTSLYLYEYNPNTQVWSQTSTQIPDGKEYNKNNSIYTTSSGEKVVDENTYCAEYKASKKKSSISDYNYFFNFIPKDYDTRKETSVTESDVLSYLASLNSQMNEDSLLLFFVSTHGGVDGGITFGTKDIANDFWKDAGISMFKVMDTLNTLPGCKFIIEDTCHSGVIVTGDGSDIPSNQFLSSDSVFVDKALSAQTIAQSIGNSSFVYSPVKDYNDVWAMTATTYDTLSKDGNSKCSDFQSCFGFFTGYVLKYLGYDMATNKATASMKGATITIHSMFNYVWNNFPEEMKKNNKDPQIPVVFLSPIDVVLFGPAY